MSKTAQKPPSNRAPRRSGRRKRGSDVDPLSWEPSALKPWDPQRFVEAFLGCMQAWGTQTPHSSPTAPGTDHQMTRLVDYLAQHTTSRQELASVLSRVLILLDLQRHYPDQVARWSRPAQEPGALLIHQALLETAARYPLVLREDAHAVQHFAFAAGFWDAVELAAARFAEPTVTPEAA